MTAETATQADRLRDQALDLPAEERATLAYDLLASLDPPPAEEDPDAVMADWGKEIRRRIADVRAGRVVPISKEECIEGMRAAVAAVQCEK